jgi:hypothetical protein
MYKNMFKANAPNVYVPSKSVAIKPEVVSDVNELDQIRIHIPSFVGFIDPNQTYLKFNIQMKNARGQLVPDPNAGGSHALFRNVLYRDGNNQATLEYNEDYNANKALLENYNQTPSNIHKRELFDGVQSDVGVSNGDKTLYYASYSIGAGSDLTNPDTSARVAHKVMVQTPLNSGIWKQGNILPVSAMNGLRIQIDTEDVLRSCRYMSLRGEASETHPVAGLEFLMTSGNKNAGTEDRTTTGNAYNGVEVGIPSTGNPFAIGDILYIRDANSAVGAGNEEALGVIQGFYEVDATNFGIAYVPLRNTADGLTSQHNTGSIVFYKMADRQVAQSYYLPSDHAGNVKSGLAPAQTYTISDMEMIVQSVQPPASYVSGLLKASQSEKGVSFDILCYELHRHNQSNRLGLTQAQIPTMQKRAKALFSQPLPTSDAKARGLGHSSLSGIVDNAKNYEWIYGTQHYPSRLAPLTRINTQTGGVCGTEALHLSELQKAIVNINEKVRNLHRIRENFCIARSLTKYGQIMDLSTDTLSLRVDYSPIGAEQKLFNNYVYGLRRITINKDGVMAMF